MSRPISTENKFRALAHNTRRGIIDLLLRKQRTASEIAEHFSHSRPVLSKHLRVLQTAGLITFQRQGTRLLYRLVPGAFDSLHQWVSRLPHTSTTLRGRANHARNHQAQSAGAADERR